MLLHHILHKCSCIHPARSLHTKSTKALRAMMSKLHVPEAVRAATAAAPNKQVRLWTCCNHRRRMRPTAPAVASGVHCVRFTIAALIPKFTGATAIPAGVNAQAAGGSTPAGDGSTAAAGVMLELLEGTLWQRQLGSLSEEMVAALVCQVRGAHRGAGGVLCS